MSQSPARTLSPAARTELWRTAHALAEAARPATLKHFRLAGLEAENKAKAGFDPVTEGDRACEEAMRAVLAELRPQDGIHGEEQEARPGTSGLTWVLDPIDGTRGYLSGTPTWGVLIGLEDEQGAVLGIVDQPYIRERFWGGLGEAFVDGPMGRNALYTRPARPLAEATLLSTFPEVGTAEEHAAFRRVADRARLTRYGMDCYGYALLAAGQVDLVIEAGLQRYDVLAPIAVIEAAGGIVTNWQGGPALKGGQVLAAANATIHAEALALLNA